MWEFSGPLPVSLAPSLEVGESDGESRHPGVAAPQSFAINQSVKTAWSPLDQKSPAPSEHVLATVTARSSRRCFLSPYPSIPEVRLRQMSRLNSKLAPSVGNAVLLQTHVWGWGQPWQLPICLLGGVSHENLERSAKVVFRPWLSASAPRCGIRGGAGRRHRVSPPRVPTETESPAQRHPRPHLPKDAWCHPGAHTRSSSYVLLFCQLLHPFVLALCLVCLW